MSRRSDAAPDEPTFRQVVFGDLKQEGLHRRVRQDLRDLYSFYLSEERREQLASMGAPRGIFMFWGWLLKSLLMKLSPSRRLALVIALVLLLWGEWQVRFLNVHVVVYVRVLGVLLLFMVLMLELKDKLLARDEIEVARQVQLSLLPRTHPRLAGWSLWSHTRPANDVGGDLIDYIETNDHRLGVALGDVAGKGMGAALLMAKLQATLRAAVPDCRSLPDLGARLNSILLRDGPPNRFATLFYLEIAPNSGRVRYVNAGHPPGLILRANVTESLASSSAPLGLIEGAVYAEGSVELKEGEILFVYSDGLSEARDAAETEFGAERIQRLLPTLRGLTAQDAGERMLKEVERFLGEARPHDDLSVMVLVRNGSGTA
ncbi:MAG TPA: PP2C family protein-serine/threonine phosphatase [Candidatus Polarisedimenticolia bacterium]|nr:PP2C family protein-serine/threonine phosphatase [Candidatus Polarisedimenticolia bacterium]